MLANFPRLSCNTAKHWLHKRAVVLVTTVSELPLLNTGRKEWGRGVEKRRGEKGEWRKERREGEGGGGREKEGKREGEGGEREKREEGGRRRGGEREKEGKREGEVGGGREKGEEGGRRRGKICRFILQHFLCCFLCG